MNGCTARLAELGPRKIQHLLYICSNRQHLLILVSTSNQLQGDGSAFECLRMIWQGGQYVHNILPGILQSL